MSYRALLYRRPSEPQAIEIVFEDRFIWCSCAATGRRGATRCASRRRRAKSFSPFRRAARSKKRASSRKSMAAGSRPGSGGCRRPPFAEGVVVPLRGVPHTASPIAAACAAPSGPKWRQRRTADLRRRRRAAYRSARRRLSAPRSQARARSREPEHFAAELGRRHQAHRSARSVEPLGLVLDHRRAVVFLAAHSGAEPCARLPRRARSGASRRDEPFAAVLAAGAAALPGSRTRQGLARRPWQPICIATDCPNARGSRIAGRDEAM